MPRAPKSLDKQDWHKGLEKENTTEQEETSSSPLSPFHRDKK